MRLRGDRVAMLWLPLLLCALGLVLAKDKPSFKRTEFDGIPMEVRYFEDTETVLAFVVEESPILTIGSLWKSTDAGEKWELVKDVGKILMFWMHPYDNKRVYAIGPDNKHYYSNDRGKEWNSFKLEEDYAVTSLRAPFSFHGTDYDKIIMNTRHCEKRGRCKETAHYTKDGFKSVHGLRKGTHGCIFAHSTPRERGDEEHEDRILCLVDGESRRLEAQRLHYSDNYFKDEKEPALDSKNGRTVHGIIDMADVKGYIVAAQKSEKTTQLNLYVSLDGQHWNITQFPHNHKLEENAYTILESTNYSIQVDVLTTAPFTNPMGTLLTSNSDGIQFSENVQYVNRNTRGHVDFEKVQGIQGIIMVNVVGNHEEVVDHRADKKLQSKISFDDGRTFHDLAVLDKDGKKTDQTLHLHSVTNARNIGRIFSGAAPGIVMGVGNVGKELKDYRDSDLYVSDDAGLSWRKALEDAHKYEFGDQGSILVAVFDEGSTNEVRYNLKHGRGKWETVELDEKIRAEALTTIPDSTSLRFILVASKKGGSKGSKYYIYSIDFEALNDKKCGKDDFEEWPARKNEKDEPDCLMGHKEFYHRRKPEAECFVDEEFKEPLVRRENCECTEEDFECDHDFKKDDGKCVPSASFVPPSGVCKEDKDGKFKGRSGYRKIPGNTCDGGKSLDKEEKEWPCDKIEKPPAKGSGEITVKEQEFKGKKFLQKVYLEKGASASGDDTVLTITDTGDVFKTTDHGKSWKPLDCGGDKIELILPHAHNNDRVFLLTNSKRVYLSTDRGNTCDQHFEAPSGLTNYKKWGVRPLTFSQNHNYLIWTGEKDGFPIASYSNDDARSWHTMVEHCKRCEFIPKESSGDNDKLVFCEQFSEKNTHAPIKLLSSNDWFQDQKKEVFSDIVAFATMSEFIVVANKDKEENLKLDASVDGHEFADARFPKNFNVPHQTAYTVLDSSTHSVFLQVTESEVEHFEYGRLMKSNSNGTFYVSSIQAINLNEAGYVDFEKMRGIEGVAMVNVVDNVLEREQRKPKKLKTMITHNDGAEWTTIRNVVDEEGKAFDGCGARDIKCSLHLHGYTERTDPRDTFSSPSAVGLMMGTGNIGEFLDGDEETNTWVTRDAGLKWHRVKEGKYMWEYGDQGSIIVIAKDGGNTKEIHYTLDEGQTWATKEFAEEPVTVMDLTTVPSDSSVQFIIWGVNNDGSLATYNIDFSGIYDRICDEPDDDKDEEGDYDLFTPQHPFSEGADKCLFGHVSTYHRKKPKAECWNGRMDNERHKAEEENCKCKRRDYECDYNYELDINDNTCHKVPGTDDIDPKQQCYDDPKLEYYFDSKGYRKIPISTCVESEDNTRYHGQLMACPNFAEKYTNRGGLRGFPLFLVAFVLPLSAAAGIGYWVYTRWDGKFGRIRLGDGGSAFDSDQPWIRWPVAALSGLVAVLAAVPLLLGAGFRSISGMFGRGGRRYTTRDSFARGRGDYAVIDPDEDELLGGVDDDEL